MYVYKIIFILSLPSIAFSNSLEKVKYRWMSTFEVQRNINFKQAEPIKKPKGIYQNILEMHFLNKSFKQKKDCLIFRPPSNKEDGKLLIVTAHIKDQCKEKIYDKALVTINNIRNFGYELSLDRLKLFVDRKEYIFQFYNFNLPKRRKLYDSSKINNKLDGTQISFVNDGEGLEFSEGDICAGYTSECEVERNLCHLCPGAITEVISNKCRGVIIKYCKNITCGDKGQPACIRGAKASEYQGLVCLPGSPLGFCQKPYKVFCENGELICR